MGGVRVGTSGWMYRQRQGRFYPAKLHAADQLPFYAGLGASFTSFALSSQSRVASASSRARREGAFGWFFSKYRPVFPTTSRLEARYTIVAAPSSRLIMAMRFASAEIGRA